MFTGIIEATGKVLKIQQEGTNKIFTIEAAMAPELKADESVSHNGVCLTITDVDQSTYNVTAVQETLGRTTVGSLSVHDEVNLERSMMASGRLDGHVVQGHIDQIGTCKNVREVNGSWLFDFGFDYQTTGNFLVEKGSICIDGVSLTAFNCERESFTVTVIPHTFQKTNFKRMKPGDKVNLEFDVLGKYIQRLFALNYQEFLREGMKGS